MKKAKLNAAKSQYELDSDGNLWTKPRGSRPIQADAVLVVVDGLAYRVAVADIKASQAKPKKRKPTQEPTKEENK